MKFSIITLFPEVFDPILNSSILKRAQKKGLVEFELINLRQFGEGVHQVVDDKPYGGGVGMVLKANVLAKAISNIKFPSASARALLISNIKCRTILTSASGAPYSQKKARELSNLEHIILVCGHYEGVDQRFIDKYVDEEISIGDYVLTGGEIPTMAIIDSITRLIPGVLEKKEATLKESFENGLLEHPQYTRPEQFEGEKVPEVLLSGHHQNVENWRDEQSIRKTKKIRPDLLTKKISV